MTWKRGFSMNVLEEEHHRIYGCKWALGLDQFEYLIENGLLPEHKVLDLGCGSGRGGIHLIDYLNAGNYVGIDGHLPSIEAFINYEIKLHRLEHKNPRILFMNLETENPGFSDYFDYILAFSVFNHMHNDTIAAHNAVSSLKNNGCFIASFGIPRNYQSWGLHLLKTEHLSSKLVPGKIIEWYVLQKTMDK